MWPDDAIEMPPSEDRSLDVARAETAIPFAKAVASTSPVKARHLTDVAAFTTVLDVLALTRRPSAFSAPAVTRSVPHADPELPIDTDCAFQAPEPALVLTVAAEPVICMLPKADDACKEPLAALRVSIAKLPVAESTPTPLLPTIDNIAVEMPRTSEVAPIASESTFDAMPSELA